MHADATKANFAPADLIFVSCGVTHPVAAWLDGLKEEGQLALPMTPNAGMGVIFGIRRSAERYFAQVLSPVMIYACAGGRDAESAAALAAGLKRGGERGVTRLHRGRPPPLEHSWLAGEDWSLAFA